MKVSAFVLPLAAGKKPRIYMIQVQRHCVSSVSEVGYLIFNVCVCVIFVRLLYLLFLLLEIELSVIDKMVSQEPII